MEMGNRSVPRTGTHVCVECDADEMVWLQVRGSWAGLGRDPVGVHRAARSSNLTPCILTNVHGATVMEQTCVPQLLAPRFRAFSLPIQNDFCVGSVGSMEAPEVSPHRKSG